MDQIRRSQQVRFNGTVYDIEPRQRLSAFDDEYVRIAPYASLAIRLICRDGHDVLRFRRLCRDGQMEPSDFDYPVEYRVFFLPVILIRCRSGCRLWILKSHSRLIANTGAHRRHEEFGSTSRYRQDS